MMKGQREREEKEREKPTPITLPSTNYFQIWKNEEKKREKCEPFGKRKKRKKYLLFIEKNFR